MLTWGVETILMKRDMDLASLINRAGKILLHHKYAKNGDRFIITSGSPVSKAGETNLMVVETI
jgi:pyruvate kinase